MGGGLYDPLGLGAPEVRRPGLPSAAWLAGALALAATAGAVSFAVWRGDDQRGEPRAVVPIERPAPVATPPAPAPAPAPTASPAPPPAVAPPGGRAEEVEIQNGVRIVRMRSGAPLPRGGAPSLAPPPPP